MYYVYLLRDKNGVFYVGYSSDLRQRINEHRLGKVRTTRKMKEPKLVYFEAYASEELAKEREKKLKQFGSSFNGLLKRLHYR